MKLLKTLLLTICLSILAAPALAALSMYSGTFAVSTGNGTQAVTGVGFQPKVIIFYYDKGSTANAFDADSTYGFSVAVDAATDQFMATRFFNEDNVATTDSSTSKVVTGTAGFVKIIQNAADSSIVTIAFTSFDADGFTITKSSNDDLSPIVKYVALAGADITGAYLAEFVGPATAIPKAFTGVGFQGNLALFFGHYNTLAGGSSANDDYETYIGAANGTQQGVTAVYGNDGSGSTNQTESYSNSSNCLAIPNGANLGIDNLASFTSFDADGFTLNFTQTTTPSAQFFALILDGTFQSHIGIQARPTGTGNQDITSPNFQTTGVMLTGGFATANATETVEGHLIVGAYDGTRNNGIWVGDAGTINTDVNMYNSAANIYTQATNPSTIAAQAAGTSLLSNGYRLNWGTVDANARLFMHIALGSAAAGGATLKDFSLMGVGR